MPQAVHKDSIRNPCLVLAVALWGTACSSPAPQAPWTPATTGTDMVSTGAQSTPTGPDAAGQPGEAEPATTGGLTGATTAPGMDTGGTTSPTTTAGASTGSTAGGSTPDAGAPDSAVSPAPDAGTDGAAADSGETTQGTDGPELWVATGGDDANDGTRDRPLESLAVAVERATPGTTIWIEAGTYPVADTVAVRTDAAEDAPIRVFGAPGARPVLDFSRQPRGTSSARGIQITGSHWHLRDLEITRAGDNCIHISGHHNTVERVLTHACDDTGIQITANSSDAADPTRASHNTVLNCDSYDNYDAQNQGENADGFAAKLYIGPGNVFRGCRAWNNADDGWDLFASDDVVVIEDCWAIANGKIGASQNNTNGDGNGFKLGGAARPGDGNMGGAVHQVTRSFSIENRVCGFVRNNNTQEPRLSMCGGRGDGRSLLCSLSNSGEVAVSMSAAEAIAAERDADGNLPPVR